jgi:hypothetical protein
MAQVGKEMKVEHNVNVMSLGLGCGLRHSQ